MPTALIADDEPLMRADLREQLAAQWPELQVLAEVDSGLQALVRAQVLKPDVLFLDLRMPGLSGMEVVQALAIKPLVVFVTAHADQALKAFEAGAVDYVVKPIDPARLAQTVAKLKRALASNGADPRRALRLLQRQVGTPPEGPSAATAAVSPTAFIAELPITVHPGHTVMTPLSETACLRADSRLTEAFSAEATGTVPLTLQQILEGDSERLFVQISDTVAVNRLFIDRVERVDDGWVVKLKMAVGVRLTVAPDRAFQFKGL